ncbi:deoxyribonuclease IV [Thermodesulfobacteriota bacterium]
MPLLGAHMSIAGHPYKALIRGGETGCKVIQIFTRNRLKWSACGLSESEIEAFNRARTETSVIPIAIHGSYLINLASPRSDARERSLLLLLNEIEWAEQLDIPYLVIHPGSHMGIGEKKGLEWVAKMINRALDRSEGSSVKILLETTAGQGTSLGYRFEHLAEIIGLTESSERVGVCFDTCHVFASGYDFRNKEAYRQIIIKFGNVIGIDRLALYHINDSKNGPGSKIDRHDHPGNGLIGLKPFSFFLNDPIFSEHPFLLETPKGKYEKGVDRDIVNLKLLEGIINDYPNTTDSG